MNRFSAYHVIRFFSALVWLVNGLFCKILNLVPRHQLIVAEILGENHAVFFTRMIGIAEVIMACWIVRGYRRKANMIVQIAVIAVMNLLEFVLVPSLLLWGGLMRFLRLYL